MTRDEMRTDARYAYRVLLYFDGVYKTQSGLPYYPESGSINTIGNKITITANDAQNRRVSFDVSAVDDDHDGEPDIDAQGFVYLRRISFTASAPCIITLYNALDYVSTHTGADYDTGWDFVAAPQSISCGEFSAANSITYTVAPTAQQLWDACTIPNKSNFTGNMIVDVHFCTEKIMRSAKNGLILRGDTYKQVLNDT